MTEGKVRNGVKSMYNQQDSPEEMFDKSLGFLVWVVTNFFLYHRHQNWCCHDMYT